MESCHESQPNPGAAGGKSLLFKMEPLTKETKRTCSFAAKTRKGLNKRVLRQSAKSGRHKPSETFPVGRETTGRRKEKWRCPVESKGYTLRVPFFFGTGGAFRKDTAGNLRWHVRNRASVARAALRHRFLTPKHIAGLIVGEGPINTSTNV